MFVQYKKMNELENLREELSKVSDNLALIAEKVQLIGEMCAQLKKVLVELADEQRTCREELSEAAGKMIASSWF